MTESMCCNKPVSTSVKRFGHYPCPTSTGSSVRLLCTYLKIFREDLRHYNSFNGMHTHPKRIKTIISLKMCYTKTIQKEAITYRQLELQGRTTKGQLKSSLLLATRFDGIESIRRRSDYNSHILPLNDPDKRLGSSETEQGERTKHYTVAT